GSRHGEELGRGLFATLSQPSDVRIPPLRGFTLMDFRDYLALATSLANGTTEADWRSAISRAYYAAFHVARQFLVSLGFRVPRADRAHPYLWLRLSNAGEATVVAAGRDLGQLRTHRNLADYDERVLLSQARAQTDLAQAEQIINALEAAAVEPV